ncbi:alpha-beta hydrolase superfamily lysophospholipase [Micromonospora pisi]|uniref:Alpha-beta hydrolase superfamily lysophospholipase n=1 Tax=Micromonospora pisi TaxID=589240 RepID=A0A495JAZ5_9ACTN|nr:alpha/beta fold hydrolase [Micromonospora pisi]RKR86075.1 alpha-beta hydrolase superfamily lysophospholipase [Micromonospora pisi]
MTTPADRSAADTIVLIHGLWMTPRSWEQWVDHYTRAGFRVLAPAWPGMEADVEQLRRDPSPIARLNMGRIIDHYDRIIRDLDRPPIIMGHSFGGSFTQVLADRGLGAAAVAIDSAGVKGVLRVPLSTLRTAWPILRSLGNRSKAVPLSPAQFHYAFTNTLSREESNRIYGRQHVPAAGGVLFEGAMANLNPRSALRINYANSDRAPLLFIAGGADHVAPPALNKSNAGRYRRSRAITGYHEFPGRAHFTLGQPGWQQVADYALEWAVEATATHTPDYQRKPAPVAGH